MFLKNGFVLILVSDLRDVVHQHLHTHPHVDRQVPGSRLSGKFPDDSF
jgi:hypothetical protein